MTAQAVKATETVQVTYSSTARKGEQVKISAVLPTRARDMGIDSLHAFQTAHQGKVDVTSLADGRLHLSHVIRVGVEGIESAAQKFADSILEHLGYNAEPQPN